MISTTRWASRMIWRRSRSLRVSGLEEGLLKVPGLVIGQFDADHRGAVVRGRLSSSFPHSTDQKASAGL